MPLTEYALKPIINRFTYGFLNVYTVADPTSAIQVGQLLGDHASKIKGEAKVPDFGGDFTKNYGDIDYDLSHVSFVNGAAVVEAQNNLTTNPLVFLIPASTTISHIILTDNNATELNRVIRGIIEIPSLERPTFTNDGAYYIGTLKVTLTAD